MIVGLDTFSAAIALKLVLSISLRTLSIFSGSVSNASATSGLTGLAIFARLFTKSFAVYYIMRLL